MIPSASEIIDHLTKDIPESKIEPVTKAEELADLMEKAAEVSESPQITPDMEEMAKLAIAQEIMNGKIDIYNQWNELFDNTGAIPDTINEEEKTAAMSVPVEGIDIILDAELEQKKHAEALIGSLTENEGHLGLHISKVFGY